MALHAPEFAPHKGWINTAAPLRLRDLRGHVVVIDFFTSCCINCLHVLPILRDLEARFADEPVVVIGVHSGKFDAEDDPQRVAEAVARHHVTHPVVVDDAMGIWSRFTVRSWPTLVIVRPDGTIASIAPGEPDAAVLDAFVRRLLDEAREAKTLASAPLRLEAPRATSEAPAPLRFPGKVAVREGWVAVADTGHHRVVVRDAAGAVVAIGSGARGLADGGPHEARFDAPQGLCIADGAVWVCDTENHAVRRIDLATFAVTTALGTGAMGTLPLGAPGPARETPLRSPWDCLWYDGALLIAMAGTHQLAVWRPADGTVAGWVGSGREALIDAPGLDAALAQPSGLSLDGGRLYFADSETSALRVVSLADRSVSTLVGTGLFDFGDVDGDAGEARLQHLLGVAVAHDGAVLIADTYNDALKRYDPRTGRVSTLAAARGQLRDPGGLAVDPDDRRIVVADTGHHRIMMFSPDGEPLGPMLFEGLRAPSPAEADAPPVALAQTFAGAGSFFISAVSAHTPASLGPGPVALTLTFETPAGWKFAADAPRLAAFEVSRRSDLVDLGTTGVGETPGEPSTAWALRLDGHVTRFAPSQIESEVLVTLNAMLCSDAEGLCVPARAWFRVALSLDAAGPSALAFRLPLDAPRR